MKRNQLDKKTRAKKKVEELKGFYGHLLAYIIVNTTITTVNIIHNINNGESLWHAFWGFETFTVWIFWGIGLAFHASKVFGYNPFFDKDWEARQIEKFMEQDRRETEKFK
tara:strand:+ start:454 stop:783 length:330 start_codon:yes stop_codon:yes gene_type:complete